MKWMKTGIVMVMSFLLLMACNTPFVPRPEGYFATPFPSKEYVRFNRLGYPYTFEYPVYATIIQDTTFFDDKPENPWWINIDFPGMNARFYISYKEIGKNNFGKLLNDAYNLTYKHTYKASSIEDSAFINPAGIHGIFFKVGGNAATANQFLLTDTTRHFLRGALYFDTAPNEDSLAPMNAFLKEDLLHLINTFHWR